MLPGLFLTLWVYLLLASGAAEGAPQLSKLGSAFDSIAQVAWLVLIGLAAGLFLHPIQFSLTQFLEGYWGAGTIGRAAAAARVLHHRRRRYSLQRSATAARKTLKAAGADEQPIEDLLDMVRGDPLIVHYLREQEAKRLSGRYPEGRRVMPTRLGNALRRFEDSVGQPYGINIIDAAPYLSMVAPNAQVEYARGAREELDTAISLCVASLLASLASVALLLTDRAWLLVSLVPYGLAYLAYRGAVTAAEEYGVALSVMLNLSRFRLYQELHLLMPDGLSDERIRNADLGRLLKNVPPKRDFPYQHPTEGGREHTC